MPEQAPSEPNRSALHHEAEFDGGSFTIEYLSSSPNGFEVKTDKSLRRREPIDPDNPLVRAPAPLTLGQKTELQNAIPGQMRFAEGDKAAEAMRELRVTEKHSDEYSVQTAKAYYRFQKKREIYLNRAPGRVGLRNIRQENNTLLVDIKPIDFPTYRLFSRQETSNELLDFSSISSTSMTVVTKDNRLIVQHRSSKNALYRDVPGAGVAGYLDGKPYTPSSTESIAEKRGTLQPIDTNFVKDNIIREANEELGLDREDFTNLRIVGITHENTQIHDEFLLFAKTNLTAEEMRQKAHAASRNSKLSDQEFDEKFVDIPATPAAIATLLTQVECPIPPTHIAGFVATGYSLVLGEKGREAADVWKNEMEGKVKQNYQKIDSMVVKYYKEHPEALAKIPQGKLPRNPQGYDPAYTPKDQGLPDIASELQRTGLVE